MHEDGGIRGFARRAASLLLLFPLATVAAWWALDALRDAGVASAGALDWIVPVMSACALGPAALGAGAGPWRRPAAWLAGTVAGALVSILLLTTAWGIVAGVVFAGLQLWQVLGVAAAVAAARAVAGARPGPVRTLLLIPLVPLTTLVTLVFVMMIAGGEQPLLALAFPTWGITVISAAGAATVVLTGRGGFPERVGAWLGATAVATLVSAALHGPVQALYDARAMDMGADAAASRLDPVFLAVQLWQGLGPLFAIVLAHGAILLCARAEDRRRARIGFSTRLDAPI